MAQSKSDVVDLNVFEDESKEEEKEEKFDFESTHEKIRRRAEHTSWLVLRLWSQIMGLSPRDDTTFERVVAQWCIKTLHRVKSESDEGEHFTLLSPTLNLLYRLSSASNVVPDLLRKHMSLWMSLLLRSSPKRKCLDIQISVVRLLRHVLPLDLLPSLFKLYVMCVCVCVCVREYQSTLSLSLSHKSNTNTQTQVRGNKCSWFLSHEEDAASMWIDSIGRLQSVPMTQCRSTIRRWDMRPESVAVRLKTGCNPMVCCSGSEEELVIAAEIVALVRVLMSSSKEWASSFNVVLRQSLCSTFHCPRFECFEVVSVFWEDTWNPFERDALYK